MFTYDHQIRVRYGDTDQMGYLYYGKYAYYYEQARAEAIRSTGISYKQIESSGTMMPITRMNTKFIGPAYYDEMLTIRTIIPHLPNRVIVFQYQVLNENKGLINEGETHQIFMNTATRKIRTAPDFIINALKPYFLNC